MELEYVIEWFSYADSDLASAEFLLGLKPKPIKIIYYHCQQSAEKYLKGYLIYKGVSDLPKTHDLVYLCKMCIKYDAIFINIVNACNVLTGYGVQPRYPHEMEIVENDMEKALEYARQVRNLEPINELRRYINNVL